VFGDSGMIEQVLMNLAVNARDAMPAGGTLTVAVEPWQVEEAYLEMHPDAHLGKFVRLRVSDTGTGMDSRTLAHMFEPFFTTKDVGKGTGLGLATVFGIVQQHQGWINVYSEIGRGTTFRVYLPLLTGPSDQKAIWPSLPPTRNGSETILLVEDDPSLRATMQTALSRFGYRILTASSGAEALEVWKQHRIEIHLLLTDMVMPDGMNGKELAERLLQENPKLKVIYASGYSADIARKTLHLQEGVNFVAKPFEAHKLAQTIRNCLDSI